MTGHQADTTDFNNDDWRAALTQFDIWLALPDVERPAWLADLAQREPALHARLLGLIAADHEADAAQFLQAPHRPRHAAA